MKVTLKQIKIKDLCVGYINNDNNAEMTESDIVAYNGKLNIRPKYQRNFIYSEDEQDEVIHSILKGYPIGLIYWASTNDLNYDYEVMDGQQRIISICNYVSGKRSVYFSNGKNNIPKSFTNLSSEEQNKINNYALSVYSCEGTDDEKLAWFKTINIAGEKLTDQELLNAVYAGPWTESAKKYFSKINCAAVKLGENYISEDANRQGYLETALKWITYPKGSKYKTVAAYMDAHKNDKDSRELELYYESVINWVKKNFTKYYKHEMLHVNWGYLFASHKDDALDPVALAEKIDKLMADDDVTNKKGIFQYVLDGVERNLSIREFSNSVKTTVYNKQNGVCPHCGKQYPIEDMQADHIIPWSKGGKTTIDNCQMLCNNCNLNKSDLTSTPTTETADLDEAMKAVASGTVSAPVDLSEFNKDDTK
jgi:hypothetical protein